MDEFKYPIGKLNIDIDLTKEMIANCVAQIEALPDILQKAVENLTDHQLDAVYRPGGWMLRQVVHHIADAIMNGYIRFKLALTEENPVINLLMKQNGWTLLTAKRYQLIFQLP